MQLNNKSYDVLKFIVQIVLPALMTLISTIGVAIGWTHTELSIVVIGAITTFLGSLLGISNNRYKKEHE